MVWSLCLMNQMVTSCCQVKDSFYNLLLWVKNTAAACLLWVSVQTKDIFWFAEQMFVPNFPLVWLKRGSLCGEVLIVFVCRSVCGLLVLLLLLFFILWSCTNRWKYIKLLVLDTGSPEKKEPPHPEPLLQVWTCPVWEWPEKQRVQSSCQQWHLLVWFYTDLWSRWSSGVARPC